MKALKKILLYIWQLPQNLLGLILLLIWRPESKFLYKDKTVCVNKKFPGGISLGNTIIVSNYPFSTKTWNTVKHEWGHTRQSLMFGPLYLLVIGIPSGLWYLIQGRIIKKDYHSVYPENWADKLGNVKR